MRLKIKGMPLAAATIAALAAGIITVPAHAAGTQRYVATTGADTGDCSDVANPCATMQYAIAQAATGDIINVAAGTYTETVNITKSVTLKGAQAGTDARNRSGAETIVQTPAGQDKTLRVRADAVTIDGFTLDGSTGTNSLGVDFVAPNTNATIVNNIIKNNKVGVDAIYTDISGLTVSRNLFDSNNVSAGSDGVYLANVTGSDIEVSDNAFKNTENGGVAAAINIQGASGTPLTNVRVLNNTSTNDTTMLTLIGVHDSQVIGNTASNESSTGILIDQDVANLTVKNNTLTNSAFGIRFTNTLRPSDGPSTNVTVTDNTISGMSSAGIRIFADAIAGGVSFSGNSITGNTVGLDNQSAQSIAANDNWWGCNAGPGNVGCDPVSGNVQLASWQQRGTDPTVPGVPNTGFAGTNLPLLGAVLGTAVVVIGGVAALRLARR